MGTTFLLVAREADAPLLLGAERVIADLERRWSRFVEDSEISILNRHPGVPVVVGPATFQVIQAAVDGAIATAGRFDPTVHKSMTALGYDRPFDELADSPESEGVHVPATGVTGIELDEALSAVTLPEGVLIDLGGIGKGTAADHASDWVMAQGAAGVAVSIGGDVRVRGESPSGGGWVFSDDDGIPLDLPAVNDGGVCTSTTRNRRWTTGRGDVHHLLDPATGAPTDTRLESVTILAASAQQAEVLTKAAMVAGDEAAAFLAPFGVRSVIRQPQLS
jgi:thiamine biosynthesis lipoprotein